MRPESQEVGNLKGVCGYFLWPVSPSEWGCITSEGNGEPQWSGIEPEVVCLAAERLTETTGHTWPQYDESNLYSFGLTPDFIRCGAGQVIFFFYHRDMLRQYDWTKGDNSMFKLKLLYLFRVVLPVHIIIHRRNMFSTSRKIASQKCTKHNIELL